MNTTYLLSLLAVCSLIGCKSSPEAAPAGSATPMTNTSQTAAAVAPSAASTGIPTYGESTREIATGVGQSFVLALPANVATPYKWVVDSTVDPTALELVTNEYSETPAPGCVGCLGVGGRRLMTFQAKRTGTLLLSLSYQSITDPKEAPANRFQAQVQVK